MADATIELFVEGLPPSIEVVRLEATDGDLYKSRKFKYVTAATLCMNEDSDSAHPNVENEDDTEIDGTSQTVQLNLNGITDKTVTLTLYGRH